MNTKFIPLVLGVVIAVGALLLLPGSPFRLGEKPCPNRCNVILIMVDTLAATHIAAHGYDRDTMPETTAFFEKRGVIFDHAMSNSPWTLPSFTSMYMSDLATDITFRDLENNNRPSLQGQLREAGYQFRAITPVPGYFIAEAITRLFKPEEMVMESAHTPLLKAIDEYPKLLQEEKPYFMLIHALDVHDPYAPKAPYDTAFGESAEFPVVKYEDIAQVNMAPELDLERTEVFELRYDQAIVQFDAQVAKFLASIPEKELKDTVVILSSDHGEAFGEHGKLGHSMSLYEEELHIPLMMYVPGVSARHIAEPVSLLDLAPTILSLAQVSIPEEFKGDDLTPLFSGKSLGTRVIPFVNGAPFFLIDLPQFFRPPTLPTLKSSGALGSDQAIIQPTIVGVKIGNEKAIAPVRTPRKAMWFDLSTDPGEQNDLTEGGTKRIPDELSAALGRLFLGYY